MPNAKALSQAIKDTLLQYQNSELAAVKTWKRGVLPPTPTFPACAVMPQRCLIYGDYNRRKQLEWEFSLEFFARHTDPRVAIETATELAQAAKMVMKQHFKLGAISGDPSSTNVVDTELQPTYTESISQPPGQYMQMAVVPLRITQYEALPDNVQVPVEAGFTDNVELVRFIQTRLENWARYKGLPNLGQVSLFARSVAPPVAKFPAVTVIENQHNHHRELTGLDIVNRTYDFSVYTNLLPQEVNFDLNLALVDQLVKVLWIDYAWGGRAELTDVEEIQFVREQNEVGRMYRSTVTANIQCREQLELAEARR